MVTPTHDHSDNRETDIQRNALPIYEAKKFLIQHLEKSATCVVIGETACGKTTKVPQFLFENGYGRGSCILCTQPRRVAAITVAKYVAS